jgi:hypothetical protein
MNSFFTDNNVKISYLDINSDNEKVLLFIHGNSHAKNSFQSQLDNPLLKNYRLIAIDLPGHGDSEQASDYSLPLFANVVNQLIIKLNLKHVLLVGHSLGGHVALHMLNLIQPEGLLIYGTPMLQKPIDFSGFLLNENAVALSKETSSEEEIESLLTELNYEGCEREKAKANFLRTDPKVRTSILGSVGNGNYSDELTLLKGYNGRLKVLVSLQENLVNNKYIESLFELENNEVIGRISAGHVPHVQKQEEFNSILINFAEKVFDITAIKIHTIKVTQMDASHT